MDTEQTTTVGLVLSYPRGNRPTDVKATLQVMDERSGHLIVHIDLTADQVADLISATHVTTAGTLAPGESRARLGMRKVIHTERIAREALNGYAYGDETRAAARAWAEGRMDELNGTQDGPEWERCSVSSHNYGWSMTFVRWEVSE